MPFGNLNLGNLADALSLSGADANYIEQLRREEALRAAAGAQQVTPAAIANNPYDLSSADVQRALALSRSQPPVGASAAPSVITGTPSSLTTMSNLPPVKDVSYDIQRAPGGHWRQDNIDMAEALRRRSEQNAAPAAGFSTMPPARDVQAALARTGSQYQLPAQSAARDPENSYTGPVLPEGTDRALELTGSQYRVPRPPTVNPQAGTQALRARSAGIANEAIADELALGDVKSGTHDRRAKLYSEDAVSGQMRMDEIQQRRDASLQRKDANTQEAYKALRDMQTQIGHPPDTSKGRALQIIGTVLSMTPRGAGIGKGMSMLGQMMGDDVQAWARGIEGNDTIRKAFLEMNRHEDAGLESELQQEMHLSTIAAANTLNSLKAAEEEAGSEEAKTVARRLARGVEDAWTAHQLEARTKLDTERGRLQEDTILLRALAQTPETDRPMVAAMYGPRGLEMLNNMNKPIAAQAELEGKRAQTEKTAVEAAEGPKLSDGERKTLRLFEGIAPSVDRVREMAATRGAPHPWSSSAPDITRSEQDLEDDAATKNVTLALLRDESGAALPPGEQAEKIGGWGVNSGDPQVRKNGLKLMLAEYDARYAALTRGRQGTKSGSTGAGMTYGIGGGLAPASGPAPGSAGATGKRYDMVNPETGETLKAVPESKLSIAQARGFVIGRPSAQELPRDDSPLRERYRQPRDAGVGAGD